MRLPTRPVVSLLRRARPALAGLLAGVAIVTAGGWPSMVGTPPVRTEVLAGDAARAFVDAQGFGLESGEDRAIVKREYEAQMRAKGWWPVNDAHTYVRRQYREVTMTRRFAEWLVPTLYADTYADGSGYIYAESWNDGDDATWEGYSEVCPNGVVGCASGISQVHTGTGQVLYAEGNPTHSQAFQSWAGCAYSGCFGMTWGCWLAGPTYFNCLGISCVGSAVGCAMHTWLVYGGCADPGCA